MNKEAEIGTDAHGRVPSQLALWRWNEGAEEPAFARSKRSLRIRFAMCLIALDVTCILAAYLLLTWVRLGDPADAVGLNLISVLLPVYLLCAFNMNCYGGEVLLKPRVGIFRSVLALCSAAGLVLLAAFFLRVSGDFSRIIFTGGSISAAVLLFGARFTFGRAALRSLGGNPYNELLVIDGFSCNQLPSSIVIDSATYGLVPDLGDPMMLDRIGRITAGVDRVVVACAAERRARWGALLKGLNIQGELIAPELEELGAIRLGRYGPWPTITVSVGPLDIRNRALKRFLDLCVALLLVAALAPLMLLIAAAIRVESRGPVFFAQRRLGRGNRLFMVHKFRSMHVNQSDPEGNRSICKGDERVTRVGRFIRATSLDELPQLLNVLRGDMSLVGPRPHALGSLAGDLLFWEVDQRYWHRHCCKPGITGLAQVRGFRGATHTRDDLRNRLDADLEYLADWTIWRDVAILLRTLRVIIHPNAY